MSEAQLVARFGFSKAAIRAALARLRAERLVLAEPRRGHVIAPLTIRDVGEIYDLRLLLEPPAAAAAGGPDRARRARRTCARARSRRSTSTTRPRSIASWRPTAPSTSASPPRGATAGRRSSSRGCSTTASAPACVALRAGAGGRGLRARDEHRALLAALEAGDGEEAARLMAAAIRAFRDELLDALRAAVVDAPLS